MQLISGVNTSGFYAFSAASAGLATNDENGNNITQTYVPNASLEYNAVDEISGIAGSAISQYGAEKQWLVHDGTLCHLSNSAQYALGVAIDNVARLMGIDETVLFSGEIDSSHLTGALTEPISSFDKVKISIKPNKSTPDSKQWFEFGTDTNNFTLVGGLSNNYSDSAGVAFYGVTNITLQGTTATYINGWQYNGGSLDHNLYARIFEIIGIGRKG